MLYNYKLKPAIGVKLVAIIAVGVILALFALQKRSQYIHDQITLAAQLSNARATDEKYQAALIAKQAEQESIHQERVARGEARMAQFNVASRAVEDVAAEQKLAGIYDTFAREYTKARTSDGSSKSQYIEQMIAIYQEYADTQIPECMRFDRNEMLASMALQIKSINSGPDSVPFDAVALDNIAEEHCRVGQA